MRHSASTNIDRLSRRDFLKIASALSLSAAGMTLLEACGVKPVTPLAEDAPLETTTIRLITTPSICLAPQYLAEDLLKGEGFTDIQYFKTEAFKIENALTAGNADISMNFSAAGIIRVGGGEPFCLV